MSIRRSKVGASTRLEESVEVLKLRGTRAIGTSSFVDRVRRPCVIAHGRLHVPVVIGYHPTDTDVNNENVRNPM